MRRSLLIFALLLALPAAAQRPPGLQPIPEPPPPPGYEPELEPQVTISRRGEDKAEEYRINNKLYMIKVTPAHGVPYYLIDDRGDGSWSRQESLDTGVRVPMWVSRKF